MLAHTTMPKKLVATSVFSHSVQTKTAVATASVCQRYGEKSMNDPAGVDSIKMSSCETKSVTASKLSVAKKRTRGPETSLANVSSAGPIHKCGITGNALAAERTCRLSKWEDDVSSTSTERTGSSAAKPPHKSVCYTYQPSLDCPPYIGLHTADRGDYHERKVDRGSEV